jgi:hypothetical protein
MKNKDFRKKQGVKEWSRCYLCNNKAQAKCNDCRSNICNDCKSNLNKTKCYKCDIIEIKEIAQ